jgi:hypothetical protein
LPAWLPPITSHRSPLLTAAAKAASFAISRPPVPGLRL